jgi:hypothetical protein
LAQQTLELILKRLRHTHSTELRPNGDDEVLLEGETAQTRLADLEVLDNDGTFVDSELVVEIFVEALDGFLARIEIDADALLLRFYFIVHVSLLR